MELAEVLARIPYVVRHGLEVREEDGQVIVRMPLARGVTNHVGSVHAGALFTAAETAAGALAYRVVPDDRAFVLLRGATIRYTRRAQTDVVASATVAEAGAEAARRTFDSTERADVEIAVRVLDASGETVFHGTFDYALRPRRNDP